MQNSLNFLKGVFLTFYKLKKRVTLFEKLQLNFAWKWVQLIYYNFYNFKLFSQYYYVKSVLQISLYSLILKRKSINHYSGIHGLGRGIKRYVYALLTRKEVRKSRYSPRAVYFCQNFHFREVERQQPSTLHTKSNQFYICRYSC